MFSSFVFASSCPDSLFKNDDSYSLNEPVIEMKYEKNEEENKDEENE